MSATRVLPGFQTPHSPWSRRLRGLALFALISAIVIYMGLGIAVLPPQLLAFPALPVIIIWLLMFWALPDRESFPAARITKYFGITLVLLVLWPPYMALDLPGVPWITPARAAYFIVIAMSMFSVATSSAFRTRLTEVLNADKWAKAALLIFLVAGLVALIASGKIQLINREVNNLLFWPFALLLAGFCALQAGTLTRFMKLLIVSSAILAMIGIIEFRVQHLLWLNYIKYFNVDPDMLSRIIDPNNMRSGSGKYRTHSTFITSLEMSEYLSLTTPFVIYYASRARRLVDALALWALAAGILVAIWCTDSRLGMVGFVLTTVTLSFLLAFRAWRNSPRNIAAAGILYLYPVLAAAFFGTILSSHRAYTTILGGAQHANSDEARIAQWHMGWPKIFHRPIGYGPGAGGDALGYLSPSGVLTVDTYYLTALLDFGIIGFIAFMAFFGRSAYLGVRTFLAAPPGAEEELAGPAAVALFNFIVIKSVLSQESNHVHAFALCGMILALTLRASRLKKPEADRQLVLAQ